MKKNITLVFTMLVLFLSACAPPPQQVVPSTPTSVEPVAKTLRSTPIPVKFTPKPYKNAASKFGFTYPDTWYGPEEDIAGNSLQITIGSDKVYPYGDAPDTPSPVKNTYEIFVQYTRNLPSNYSNDNYRLLLGVQDGDSITTMRDVKTRLSAIQLGRFEGVEYISTSLDTVNSIPFYTHEFLLMDKKTKDLISVIGKPTNINVTDQAKWRDSYMLVDDANLSILLQVVESITVE